MATWIYRLDPGGLETTVKIRADQRIVQWMEAGLGVWVDDPENPPDLSRTQLKKLIESGSATVNSKKLKANQKLALGDLVEVIVPEPKPLDLMPENLPVLFLHEDQHLVVLEKPAGMLVHPTDSQRSGTLVNALLFHIKNLSGIGGKIRPGIVHRLDKETSGVMVVAKTDEAHRKLSEMFKEHSLHRQYWALCYGKMQISGKHKVETKIGRNPTERLKMVPNIKDGRIAITFFETLESYGKPKPYASLVQATLHTGRTHQVRVHATHLGASLLGDALYGTPTTKQDKWTRLPSIVQEQVLSLQGQLLHARVLEFKHPITAEALSFKTEPPTVFQNIRKALQSL